MKILTNIGVLIASAIVVYFLHPLLKAEMIPTVLFVLVFIAIIVDFSRRYFYLIGLSLYPIVTIFNVALNRDQSLYPIVIFYELATITMIIFSCYLGIKVKRWSERKFTS